MDALEIIRSSNGSSSTDGLDYAGLLEHHQASGAVSTVSMLSSVLFMIVGDGLMKSAVNEAVIWDYTEKWFGSPTYHDIVVDQSKYLTGQISIAGSIAALALSLGSLGYSIYRYEQAIAIGPAPIDPVEQTETGTYVMLRTNSDVFSPDFSHLKLFPRDRAAGSVVSNHSESAAAKANEGELTFDPAVLADQMHAEQLARTRS